MKKIYSLNLIAYIKYKTGLEPKLEVERDNTAYAIFPESQEVAKAIKDFKKDECLVNLHQFLNLYKELRIRINKLRSGSDGFKQKTE